MSRFSCVVVLYEMNMTESPTLCSLFELRELLSERGIDVLILDNTPGRKAESLVIDADTRYVAFGENRGLAEAYQAAFLSAKAAGIRFLVLLDQDSQVDSSFICALDDIAECHDATIGIWCPDVISYRKRISPYSLNALGWPNYSPRGDADRLYAINSFSVVSIDCIEAIGGFEPFYWLDCLDSWIYESAQRRGWTVRRLGVNVRHDLSLVSGKISLARIRGIAFFESCFAVEYGSAGRVAGTVLRLILRGLKRFKIIGGLTAYGSYLREIARGIDVGLKRRRQNADDKFRRDTINYQASR
jgi:GT2 family glycosyltransferase